MATVTRRGRAALEHPEGLGPRLLFVEVEAARAGERPAGPFGVDLVADDPDAEAGILQGLGATVVRADHQDGAPCVVMADPEGHPFRIFRRHDGGAAARAGRHGA